MGKPSEGSAMVLENNPGLLLGKAYAASALILDAV
jgi:hypothetical protein